LPFHRATIKEIGLLILESWNITKASCCARANSLKPFALSNHVLSDNVPSILKKTKAQGKTLPALRRKSAFFQNVLPVCLEN